jgi:Tfp pilus assembly protein PilN
MEQQVNLYQPIFRAEKRLFSARAIVAGLGLLAASLVVLAGYAAWQTKHAEAVVAQLEAQERARLAMLERASSTNGPGDLQAVEADIATLSRQVDVRERVLRVIGPGTNATRGFAARLDALARPTVDGLWLKRIVFDPAHGGLALEGATSDARLVPTYLAELRGDAALAGSSFTEFRMRRGGEHDAGAAAVFTASAPGLVAALRTDPFDDAADAPKGTRP